MSDFSAMNISSAGMSLERLRLDLTSLNVANMNTGSRIGEAYIPKHLNSQVEQVVEFDALLNYQRMATDVFLTQGQTKQVYEPTHPLANNHGFVEYPDLNPLTETMNMMSASRAYEANVKAFNASKLMLEETLKLGK